MKRAELDGMSTDDLWSLHVQLSQLLQQKIQQEKLRLEERLGTVANSRSVWASAVTVRYRHRNEWNVRWTDFSRFRCLS